MLLMSLLFDVSVAVLLLLFLFLFVVVLLCVLLDAIYFVISAQLATLSLRTIFANGSLFFSPLKS